LGHKYGGLVPDMYDEKFLSTMIDHTVASHCFKVLIIVLNSLNHDHTSTSSIDDKKALQNAVQQLKLHHFINDL